MKSCPAFGVETEALTFGEGFLRAAKGAFEHEVADLAVRCCGGGLLGALGIRCQPEVEFFGAVRARCH